MPMRVIHVSPDTIDVIFSQNKSIDDWDKVSLLRDVEDGSYYFVPEWDESTSKYTGWALIPERSIGGFDFDAEKAKTEFVTLTRKAA